MGILVGSKGQQLGPYTLARVRAELHAGKISPDDLGWHKGMKDWEPLNTLLPRLMSEARTEPLSIWSLVLGVFSLFCCLSGIPAIICGHVGLAKIKANPALQGGGMAIAGLIMGYIGTLLTGVAILAALALPAVSGALERAKAVQLLNCARQIHISMNAGAVDAVNSGNKSTSWPVEAEITSVPQLKQMLVANSYFTAADLNKLRFEDLLIGNISEADPPDTIAIKSKLRTGKPVIIVRKDGSGQIYNRIEQIKDQDPPRTPSYLAE